MSGNDSTTPKPFDDELLSAYLDEQLSDEERARVESHLAENVEARQLLDELATVSSTVRSLPELTVDDRFTSDVLAAAERSRCNPHLDGGPRLAEETASSNETDPIPISVGRSARGWVWAALAVAAALLVMFISGDRLGEDREVAEVDEPAGAGAAVATDREKSDEVDRDATIEADDFAGPAKERFVKDDGESDFTRGIDALAKPAAKASEKAETTPKAGEGDGIVYDKGSPVISAPEPLATNQPKAPQSKSNGLWAGRGGEMSVPSDAPESVPIAKTARRGLGQSPAAMRAAAMPGPAIEQNEEIQSFFDANNIVLEEDEPVLVVQVDLTPEAAHNQAFDAVLLNNSISYEDDVGPLADALADNADKRAADGIPKYADADPYEVVVIDATPSQLHAALNEINNDRGNYEQLQIAPSNEIGETTNVWRQYNRGQVIGEQLNRRQANGKARSPNRASGMQQPASDGAGGGRGYGRRLGSDDANVRQQAPEQTQGRAWRFRVDQNQQRGRKTPEGDRYGASQGSNSEQGNSGQVDSEQGGSIRQEQANSGELPLAQLGQQLRSGLGEGRSIRQKAAQEATQGRICAVFLLRVVPQQQEAAAQEPTDEP